MKRFKFLFLVIFISTFVQVKDVSSQAVHYPEAIINIDIVKNTRDDDGNITSTEVLYSLNSGIENMLVTPVGKILRIVTFQIDKNHPILEIANPVVHVKMTAYIDLDEDGEDDVKIVDKSAVLTHNGKFKIIYHGDAL